MATSRGSIAVSDESAATVAVGAASPEVVMTKILSDIVRCRWPRGRRGVDARRRLRPVPVPWRSTVAAAIPGSHDVAVVFRWRLGDRATITGLGLMTALDSSRIHRA